MKEWLIRFDGSWDTIRAVSTILYQHDITETIQIIITCMPVLSIKTDNESVIEQIRALPGIMHVEENYTGYFPAENKEE